jgi:hypothetical protein
MHAAAAIVRKISLPRDLKSPGQRRESGQRMPSIHLRTTCINFILELKMPRRYAQPVHGMEERLNGATSRNRRGDTRMTGFQVGRGSGGIGIVLTAHLTIYNVQLTVDTTNFDSINEYMIFPSAL